MKLFRAIVLGTCLIIGALWSLPAGPGRVYAAEREETLGALRFTSVATEYLPILIVPENELKIVALVYAGSDEYIEIRNEGPGAQTLDGWSIFSIEGTQTFLFPAMTLGKGKTVRVHSGPGAIDNPPDDLRWTGAFIWNNAGDAAELRDEQGEVRSSFCYGGGCP